MGQLTTIMVARIILTIFLLKSVASQLEFTSQLPISEHDVEYNQTMTLNLLTGDVKMHVPLHHRDNITFYEHDRVENKELGIMVGKLTVEGYCMMSSIPGDMLPQETVIIGAALTANHSKLTLDQTELHYFFQQCQGQLSEEEREDLDDEMKEMCGDLPIFHVLNIPITEDQFYAFAEDTEETEEERAMLMRPTCDCCGVQRMMRSR